VCRRSRALYDGLSSSACVVSNVLRRRWAEATNRQHPCEQPPPEPPPARASEKSPRVRGYTSDKGSETSVSIDFEAGAYGGRQEEIGQESTARTGIRSDRADVRLANSSRYPRPGGRGPRNRYRFHHLASGRGDRGARRAGGAPPSFSNRECLARGKKPEREETSRDLDSTPPHAAPAGQQSHAPHAQDFGSV